MVTLRHITAAEVRNQQRERERERLNVNKKEKNSNRTRENETGISSMIGFDNATSSFLTLLIKKSYRKLKKAKLK